MTPLPTLLAEARREAEELSALAEKATPGPWIAKGDPNAPGIFRIVLPVDSWPSFAHHDPENAEFIAASRTAAPRLAAALLALIPVVEAALIVASNRRGRVSRTLEDIHAGWDALEAAITTLTEALKP